MLIHEERRGRLHKQAYDTETVEKIDKRGIIKDSLGSEILTVAIWKEKS